MMAWEHDWLNSNRIQMIESNKVSIWIKRIPKQEARLVSTYQSSFMDGYTRLPNLPASFRLFWRDIKLFRVDTQDLSTYLHISDYFGTGASLLSLLSLVVQNSEGCHWLFRVSEFSHSNFRISRLSLFEWIRFWIEIECLFRSLK